MAEPLSLTFQNTVKYLESPQPLESIYIPLNNSEGIQFPSLEIYIQQENGSFPLEPTTLSISSGSSELPIPPYFTIQDVYRLLWKHQDESDAWLPNYTFIGVPEQLGAPTSSTTYTNALGLWYLVGAQTYENTFSLPNPMTLLNTNQPMQQFVTATGERMPVSFKVRDRTTLEDAFWKSQGEFPILHAYNLQTLMRRYKGEQPISARAWNGLFYPYFPRIAESGPYTPTEADKVASKQIRDYITLKMKESVSLQEKLEEGPRPLHTDKLRHLQFKFNTPNDFSGLDVSFYTIPATQSRPYLRYIPATGSAMTKLFRKSALDLPEVSDCTLLTTWGSETVPEGANEIVFGKVKIIKKDNSLLAYGTLRIKEDGRADFTIQPASNVRDFDMEKDILEINIDALQKDFSLNLPYSLDSLQFSQATLHMRYKSSELGEKIQRDILGRKYSTEITRQVLRERLNHFKTFFQEIQPHEGDQAPSIMLRYKGVTNFENEDRISAYLSYQSTKRLLQGTALDQNIVKDVAMQFTLSEDEARSKVAAWLSKKTDLTISDPDAKEAQQLYNPGTDIAVYLQHPNYTFHIFRVESLEDLDRIQTLLSVLFTLSDDKFDKDEAPSAKIMSSVNAEEVLTSKPIGMTNGMPDIAPGDDEEYQYVDFGDEMNETNQVDLVSSKPDEERVQPLTEAPKTEIHEDKDKDNDKESAIIPTEDGQGKPIVAYEFYIKRLKALDPKLFSFKVQNPGDAHYTEQCPARDTRMPLIMTPREYSRMKEIYEEDLTPTVNKEGKNVPPNLVFIEYGSDKLKEQEEISKTVNPDNRITVLKYGSSDEAQNYYICAKYFCLKDYLILIPEEFEKAGIYRGSKKEANECPFCHNKIIPHKNLANPAPGQTVIVRKVAPSSDNKFHLFVRFLKNVRHPDNLDMPCCFISKPNPKEYSRLTTLSKKTATKRKITVADVNLPVAGPQEEQTIDIDESLDDLSYYDLGIKVGTRYMLDIFKYPLPAGKIGQCGPALDAYFSQKTEDLTNRELIKLQLKPKAKGFIRIGVPNRTEQQFMSLFSALAPILGFNTPRQVANAFFEDTETFVRSTSKWRITPREFIGLNFGNLLLEFYALSLSSPIDSKHMRRMIGEDFYLDIENFNAPTDDQVRTWAVKELRIENDTMNINELQRAFRAYYRFGQYIHDAREPKQLRHFIQHLNENSLTLIVLEYKGVSPTASDATLNVRCPAYGYDIERYDHNEIAFLTTDAFGVWEPIGYVYPLSNLSRLQAIYSFSWEKLSTLAPNIVRERKQEFSEQCKSSYRGIYTSQPYIDSKLLIPMSVMILFTIKEIKGIKIYGRGTIRDAYNHLVAITIASPLEENISPKERKEIVVPIADDGLSLSKYQKSFDKTYLSWQDVMGNLASAEAVYAFYTIQGEKRFVPFSTQYKFYKFIESNGQIVAFQLGLPLGEDTLKRPLITLPCGPATTNTIPKEFIDVRTESFQYPFLRDYSLITATEPSKTEEYKKTQYALKREEAEELYQQFRLTFANWIAVGSERAPLRSLLRKVYEKRAPLEDKRKDLETLLGSVLRSWLAPDPKRPDLQPSFLRTDCLTITFSNNKEQCEGTGRCKWFEEETPKCRIHVPEKVPVRQVEATVFETRADIVFCLRLYDELLRLPMKRYELLNKAVKKIQVPTKEIQVGTQYVIPESIPAYEELFQKLCKKDEISFEKPQFYEEYSRNEEELSEITTSLGRILPLPEELSELLAPEFTASLGLRLVGGEEDDRLLAITTHFGIKKNPGTSEEILFTQKKLEQLSYILKKPVVQISMQQLPDEEAIYTAIYGQVLVKDPVIVILPDTQEGPAILTVKSSMTTAIPLNMLRGPIKDAVIKSEPLASRNDE